MTNEKLTAYADLLLTTGVNLQPDQILVISADVENQAFALTVTQAAYALGAREVVLNWRCQPIGREKLLHANEAALEKPAPWVPDYYKHYIDEGAAFLTLISADPKALQGVPPNRIALQSKGLNQALTFYHDAIMGSAVTWCVAAVATLRWAALLGLTGATDEEKTDKLWSLLFALCRLEGTGEEERLQAHLETLQSRTQRLNDLKLAKLHYQCSNGTNLLITLPENHVWQGGAEYSQKNILFTANIPTEEVFTAPLSSGVNGIVYNTKPLVYHGNTIDDFHLVFERGKVVNYAAGQGQEFLQELLATDEGSLSLGEVALVDHYSPISSSNMIFYETLFDENASCHLALGAAYPTCVKNGEAMSLEELKAAGLNKSLTHVDFMIGHSQLTITGYTKEGKELPIMIEGHLQV